MSSGVGAEFHGGFNLMAVVEKEFQKGGGFSELLPLSGAWSSEANCLLVDSGSMKPNSDESVNSS